MKIGIVTFWETSDNYGQVLQGFALQTFLNSLGHESYIIRYDHNGRDKYKKHKTLRRICKVLLVWPLLKYLKERRQVEKDRALTEYSQKRNEERRFDDFRNRHFQYSDVIYRSLEELQKNPPKADAYIAGSDQIWGKSWLLDKRENEALFLNFGPETTRRIAYAPSFSMLEYPGKCRKALKRQLARFDALSVRESTGVAICESVGFHAEWVCDPTFLLQAIVYEKLLSSKPQKPFLYVYCLNIKSEKEIGWDSITLLSKKKNLDVRVTVASGYFGALELFNNVDYDYATVEGWLANVKYAEIVFTTSFHGVVFCILFHKKFVFYPLNGTYSAGNDRVLGLLERLGLSSQVYHGADSIDSIYNNEINWDKVEEEIDEFRNSSKQYLIDNLY